MSNTSNGNGRKFKCEKPQSHPNHDQPNCLSEKEFTSNIFQDPYKLCDGDIAAALSLIVTTDRDLTTISFSQISIQQTQRGLIPVLSSIRSTDSKR